MTTRPISNHLSSQFDQDLSQLASRVMAMGGALEQQIVAAMQLLSSSETHPALNTQEQTEKDINAMEREVDALSAYLIARRQPAAQDLRFVLSMLKVCNNLERMADESIKIIRQAHALRALSTPNQTNAWAGGVQIQSNVLAAVAMCQQMTRAALDALARLSVSDAKAVLVSDAALDTAYRNLMTQLIGCVQAVPQLAASVVEVLFLIKAIERIGDHAKNIAECVVYIAQGEDIRHTQTLTH